MGLHTNLRSKKQERTKIPLKLVLYINVKISKLCFKILTRGVGDQFTKENLFVGIESVDNQAHQLSDFSLEGKSLHIVICHFVGSVGYFWILKIWQDFFSIDCICARLERSVRIEPAWVCRTYLYPTWLPDNYM